MTTRQRRLFSFEIRSETLDEYDVSLASDYPVDRGGYVERLDMSREAVDLSRAVEGLPLLADHGHVRLGRITKLRTDGQRLRGKLRFFDTAPGREARAEVQGGHREVSIGYEILDTDATTTKGVLVLKRWRPYEGSLVAVPADPTVGINRSLPPTGQRPMNTTDHAVTDAADTGSNELSRAHRRAAGRQASDESERIASIGRLARAYGQYLKPSDVSDCIANGADTQKMNELIMTRMQSGATDTSTLAGPAFIRQHGDPENYSSRYSVTRAVQVQVDPVNFARSAGFEVEISQELLRANRGLKANGMIVPAEAFFGNGQQRAMSAGVAGLGGVAVETSVYPMWIEALRARSVVLALGATVINLDGPTNMPKKSSTTSVGWLAETGQAASTDVGTGVLSFTPKRAGAYSDISKQLVITNSAAIDSMLRDDLRQTVIHDLDMMALNGTGASNQPRGVRATAGIGSVVGGANGAQLTWAHVLDLEKAVDDANGIVNLESAGYAINGSTRSFLKRTPRSGSNALDFVMRDAPNDEFGLNVLNGYRCSVSSKLPKNLVKGSSGAVCSSLVFGDWSQLILATFGGGVEIMVDPYTLAATGQIRIHANIFADVGVRNAQSFAVMDDGLTT